MRLWHKDLIPVLPRQQLVAQWRELSSIAGNIKTKGTPNHILVNKVLDYPYDHFISYAAIIRTEMTKRGYRTMNSVWEKIVNLKPNYQTIPIEEIYPEWMNDDYLTICYYNLYEKHICGGINSVDWEKIDRLIFKHDYEDLSDYLVF